MPQQSSPNFYQLMLGLPGEIAQPNHYQLLGIEPGTTDDRAIRNAAADQNGKLLSWQNSRHFKQAGELMLELAKARNVLLDSEKREAYDQQLGLVSAEEEPIILLEEPPLEEPVLLDSAEEEPRRSSSRSRSRTTTSAPEKELPRQLRIAAIAAVGVVGLVMLSWAAMKKSNTEPASVSDKASLATAEDSSKTESIPQRFLSPQEKALLEKSERDAKAAEVTKAKAAADAERKRLAALKKQQPDPLQLPNPAVANKPIPNLKAPLAIAPFDAQAAATFQQSWATALGTPVEVMTKDKLKLRLIPPGEFPMGTPLSEPGRKPDEHQHLVRITKPFYMGVYEVTVEQYLSGINYLNYIQPSAQIRYAKMQNAPMLPVSLFDAINYCNLLSKAEGLEPYYTLSNLVDNRRSPYGSNIIQDADVTINGGLGYRLPTEAEWEYACRAGTTTATHYGNSLSEGEANINGTLPYNGGTRGQTSPAPQPVGSYLPNAFGLFDMHGNISEFCIDQYHDQFYLNSPQVDPVNLATDYSSKTRFILRGGSFQLAGLMSRSGARMNIPPGIGSSNGFRVVRDLPPDPRQVPIKNPDPDEPEDNNTLVPAKAPFDAQAAFKHQIDWATALGVPVEEKTKDQLVLRLIPAGEFAMGSPFSEANRISTEFLHPVKLTKPFYLGAKEVSTQDFQKIIAPGGPLPPMTLAQFGAERHFPIRNVTYFDALNFCNQLSKKEGFPPYYSLTNIDQNGSGWSIRQADVKVNGGEGYRLPTEAEWEFACRAGTETPWHFGKTLLPNQAQTKPKTGVGPTKPDKVGKFPTNAFGLYDMHGNVMEWCFDYIDPLFFQRSPVEDPIQDQLPPNMPANRVFRVVRGGGYLDLPERSRSALRSGRPASYAVPYLGFRIARTPNSKGNANNPKGGGGNFF